MTYLDGGVTGGDLEEGLPPSAAPRPEDRGSRRGEPGEMGGPPGDPATEISTCLFIKSRAAELAV